MDRPELPVFIEQTKGEEAVTIKSIMSRKSVRNYGGEPLNGEDLAKLRAFIEEVNGTTGVFGNKVRLQYLKNGEGARMRGRHVRAMQNEAQASSPECDVNLSAAKLGTYGVIQGARAFIAAACKKGAYDMEDVGYQFEKLILFATGLGLATVCLGGTFSRGAFSKAMKLHESEVLPIVSPVGYEGGKKSLLGRVIKSNAGNRKPWGELFFDGDLNTPLSAGDEFTVVLEAVRQAPSAVNAQPWRILKDGSAFHFYSAGKNYMNRMDMGIALCHFEVAAAEKGFAGKYEVIERRNEGELKYLVSWKRA